MFSYNAPPNIVGISEKTSLSLLSNTRNTQTIRSKKGELPVFFLVTPPRSNLHRRGPVFTINEVKHCYSIAEISAGLTNLLSLQSLISKLPAIVIDSAIEISRHVPCFSRCPLPMIISTAAGGANRHMCSSR